MSHAAITYLVYKFFYRIADFLRHWYKKSARIYWHFVINKFERIDYYLAWKITLKNLFTPLYKDYTALGYVVGFALRSLRIIVATAVYAVLFSVAIALYLVWLIIPAILILGSVYGKYG